MTPGVIEYVDFAAVLGGDHDIERETRKRNSAPAGFAYSNYLQCTRYRQGDSHGTGEMERRLRGRTTVTGEIQSKPPAKVVIMPSGLTLRIRFANPSAMSRLPSEPTAQPYG